MHIQSDKTNVNIYKVCTNKQKEMNYSPENNKDGPFYHMERNRRRAQWSNYHLYIASLDKHPEDNIQALSQQPSGGPHVQLTQPRHLKANNCPVHL